MPQRLSLHANAYKEKEGALSKYDDISTLLKYLL